MGTDTSRQIALFCHFLSTIRLLVICLGSANLHVGLWRSAALAMRTTHGGHHHSRGFGALTQLWLAFGVHLATLTWEGFGFEAGVSLFAAVAVSVGAALRPAAVLDSAAPSLRMDWLSGLFAFGLVSCALALLTWHAQVAQLTAVVGLLLMAAASWRVMRRLVPSAPLFEADRGYA
jgi:hypothetical protein